MMTDDPYVALSPDCGLSTLLLRASMRQQYVDGLDEEAKTIARLAETDALIERFAQPRKVQS